MKHKVLLLAAVCLALVRVDALSAQTPKGVRLVFNQAHGEQPPPSQLEPVARKLGLGDPDVRCADQRRHARGRAHALPSRPLDRVH